MPETDKNSARLSFEVSDAAEVAKYAFDQKVEESGLRVLRSRLYPLITVITAMLATFGLSLTWWVNKVSQRAEDLNKGVATAQVNLGQLHDDIKAFQTAAREMKLKSDQLDIEMRALARRGELVDAQSISALTGAAAAQNSGAAAREMAIHAQDALTKALSDINRRSVDLEQTYKVVEANAVQSTRERQTIETIRNEAERFATAVNEHRNLVAATIVDSITLRSHDTSEVVVPNLTASGTFRIRFNTGSIEKKHRFEVTYSINGGQPQIVKVSRDDIRRQIALDGTDGQYQFMMEFIYSAITVPDFVTIRVSGVPVKVAEGQSSVLVQR